MSKTFTNSLGQPIGAPLDITLPRPRPPSSPMKGRFCSVVPTNVADHSHALFDAFSLDTDERTWTYLPYGPFGSVKAFQEWANVNCTGDDPLFHTILNSDDVPVGLASFLRIDPDNGSIEVGHIHYSPLIQRKAAATEAMFLMMSRVFEELGYRRYEWKCDELNEPSCKAAKRLGFTYEGTFRQATHYKGRNRDTAWFSIIDKEWPRVREAFTLWLELANFDESGKQKSPLKAKATAP